LARTPGWRPKSFAKEKAEKKPTFGKQKSQISLLFSSSFLECNWIDRSYGVVLWELLTRETPYRDKNYGAILYGVGSNQLQLHLPPTLPAALLDLMEKCRDKTARKRPSFLEILRHLSDCSAELVDQEPVNYANLQLEWKKEICSFATYRSNHHSTVSSGQERETMDAVFINEDNNRNNNNNDYVDGGNSLANRQAQIKHVEDLLKDKLIELVQSKVYNEVVYYMDVLKEMKPKNKEM
jgi:serine/threonine protein kinase